MIFLSFILNRLSEKHKAKRHKFAFRQTGTHRNTKITIVQINNAVTENNKKEI